MPGIAKQIKELAERIDPETERTGAARRRASVLPIGMVSFGLSKSDRNVDIEDKILKKLDEMLDEYEKARGPMLSYDPQATQSRIKAFYEDAFSHTLTQNSGIKERILNTRLPERSRDINAGSSELREALDNEPTREGKRWVLLNFIVDNPALANKIREDQPEQFSDAALESIVKLVTTEDESTDFSSSLINKIAHLKIDIVTENPDPQLDYSLKKFMISLKQLKTVDGIKNLFSNPRDKQEFMDILKALAGPSVEFPKPKNAAEQEDHVMNPRPTKAEIQELLKKLETAIPQQTTRMKY